MTAALLAVGWAGTCLLEWNNPETLGGMTVGEKLLNGFFQSATLRTAGFAAIDQAKLTESGKAFSCVLMSIGGSSGSTAGGIKTVTFLVLALTIWARARGKSTVCSLQADDPRRPDPERHDHCLYRAGTGRFRRHFHQCHVAHELYGRRV